MFSDGNVGHSVMPNKEMLGDGAVHGPERSWGQEKNMRKRKELTIEGKAKAGARRNY